MTFLDVYNSWLTSLGIFAIVVAIIIHANMVEKNGRQGKSTKRKK